MSIYHTNFKQYFVTNWFGAPGLQSSIDRVYAPYYFKFCLELH